VASETVRHRGRPRDPGLEERVFEAALSVYEREGWPGFTFDAIARAASVGKAGLYRRWSDRGELLREMLAARWISVGEVDTGTLRGDLLALAGSYMRTLTGPHGRVGVMLQADRRYEDVQVALEPHRERIVREARRLVSRAIERGELPDGTSVALILDVLIGAVSNRVAATPSRLRTRMLEAQEGFLDNLVDLLVRGSGAIEGRQHG
jgi:AcrR family transcriptional regulator